MTARPGRIKAEITVPLPRPRTPELTCSAPFVGLVQKLKALIREESLAAMGSELKDGGLRASAWMWPAWRRERRLTPARQ